MEIFELFNGKGSELGLLANVILLLFALDRFGIFRIIQSRLKIRHNPGNPGHKGNHRNNLSTTQKMKLARMVDPEVCKKHGEDIASLRTAVDILCKKIL